LVDVGLDYLTLDRSSATLSGGEMQRIRLATQIGSGLTGVLYVLDEPTIGLHPRDNERLISTLKGLRDKGNTLVVVEHDAEMIKSADWVVDLGPGAGVNGGKVSYQGSYEGLLSSGSLTGQYLTGVKAIERPEPVEISPSTKYISIAGVTEHNLKNVTAKFPIGAFSVVTGVSGSGKSTLIDKTLKCALFAEFYGRKEKPGKFKRLTGTEFIDKVVEIDQSPIGRTPRSNPATYVGFFSEIRELFAQTPSAKARGYTAGRFSFNVKGGRCEVCSGDGVRKLEMSFLPDVYITCEQCNGRRFNSETLEVTYNSRNISQVLDMSVSEACDFFAKIPSLSRKLNLLKDVGLGYMALGQSATTLSGGEAQRIKLAAELAKRSTGKTLYLLDEPTTGLHFDDVSKLMKILFSLRDQGNTIIVIEHNVDVIRSADWVVDLGPEGGEGGGNVVYQGPLKNLSSVSSSHTARYI
jgi:excinuclease ABC subunit A